MKKIFEYIRKSFFLRNILLAVCLLIVGTYVVSLMLNLFTRHGQKQIVPSFIGLSVDEARNEASNADLELIVIDSLFIPKSKPGSIVDQSPRADMGVKSGRKVFLTINSFRPKMAEVPYVSGFSLRQAKNKLESSGFEIDQIIYQSDIATNNVLSQSWNGQRIGKGSKVMAELGSAITLTVGRDSISPMPMVPKLIGLTLREAKSRLWEIGFNLGAVEYELGTEPDDYDRAKIYKQIPLQEARNNFGSRVSVWLTMDNDRVTNSSRNADKEARKEIKTDDDISEEQMLKALGVE